MDSRLRGNDIKGSGNTKEEHEIKHEIKGSGLAISLFLFPLYFFNYRYLEPGLNI